MEQVKEIPVTDKAIPLTMLEAIIKGLKQGFEAEAQKVVDSLPQEGAPSKEDASKAIATVKDNVFKNLDMVIHYADRLGKPFMVVQNKPEENNGGQSSKTE